jgi:hypothetical protein
MNSCRTVRDWFLNETEAGVFHIDGRIFHLKMAERNESILFPVSDSSAVPVGVSLIERVYAFVQCGLEDKILENASFLEERFLQLTRDREANLDPAFASKMLSLLERFDVLVGCLADKKEDRRFNNILRCFRRARAILTPQDQVCTASLQLSSFFLVYHRFVSELAFTAISAASVCIYCSF